MANYNFQEIYKCRNCPNEFKYQVVNKYWICPVCQTPISVKVKINNYINECQYLKPKELKIGYLINLGNNNTHSILNIKYEGNCYVISLSDYGNIKREEEDFLLVIMGSWND